MHCQYFPSLQLKHFLGNMPGTIGRVKAQNRKEGWVGGGGGRNWTKQTHSLHSHVFKDLQIAGKWGTEVQGGLR